MSVNTITFSDFFSGGNVTSADLVVGLQDGVNAKFTIPSDDISSWTVVTENLTMVSGQGYLVNSATTIHLLLPESSSVGDMISIGGFNTGVWQITQSENQNILISPTATTVGTDGSLTAAHGYDSINLVCCIANLQWIAIGAPQSTGLTVV